jgi:hypothetical protein
MAALTSSIWICVWVLVVPSCTHSVSGPHTSQTFGNKRKRTSESQDAQNITRLWQASGGINNFVEMKNDDSSLTGTIHSHPPIHLQLVQRISK